MTLRRFLEIVGVEINKEKVQEVLDYDLEFLAEDREVPTNYIDINVNDKTITLKY